MKHTSLLAAVAALLGLGSLAQADVVIPAQPITLNPNVGSEQSDFFFSSYAGSDYVLFTGALPYAPSKGAQEIRYLYISRIHYPGVFLPIVGKYSPLAIRAGFRVPVGTRFDTFIQSDISSSYALTRQIFRVPGVALYMLTNAGAPVALRLDTAAAPISGVAFRYPANAYNDRNPLEQNRVVFGAKDPTKGFEPFLSYGSARLTALLKDIQPGAPSSSPDQFTTYNKEAYFVATTPTLNTRDVFRYSTTKVGTKYVTTAANVTTGLAAQPSQLTGSSAGLFYTSTSAGAARSSLYRLDDQGSFDAVQLYNSGGNVFDAQQITPSVDPQSSSIGFSAFDSVTGKRRFATYSSFNDGATFTELTNAPAGTASNPDHIVSTGDHYFFTADNGIYHVLMRASTGSSSHDYVLTQLNDYVYNVDEMVDVRDTQNSGQIYFTATTLVNGNYVTGVLMSLTPDADTPVAKIVLTKGGNPVIGAHNLRAVYSGQIFRLYFTAPVNTTQNNEYAVPAKDYGTKPWVVNVE